MRRAATVSLVIPVKKGLFLKEAFTISDILMDEKEDLVQKGFGWLLKEESRTRQKEYMSTFFRRERLCLGLHYVMRSS